MSLSFEIDIVGLNTVLNELEGIQTRAVDLRPIANTIALALMADVDERFNSSPGVRSGGQVYGGVTWDSLTDAYLARKPKREGGQILRDTGEMMNSFTVGQPGNIFESESDSVAFGSSLPKARGHQFGIESRGVSARPIIVIHDELVSTLRNILLLYVTEGIV